MPLEKGHSIGRPLDLITRPDWDGAEGSAANCN